MKKLKGIFNLIRFELPLSAGICVMMGQLLAAGEFASLKITLLAFMSVFFISSSILVSNDIIDFETDKINAPNRPIPSGLISKIEAAFLATFLLFVGMVLSYFINLYTFIIALVLSLVGYLYNLRFKKTGLPGNIMVCFSVGMTFIYGGASVAMPFDKAVILFALIAALIDLGEEIAADSMDIEGDKLINSNSIAIKYGRKHAIKISNYIFAGVVLLAFMPHLLNWFDIIYLIPIIIMNLAIITGAFKLSKSEGDEGRKYLRWIYLGATAGLVLFIFIKFIDS